MDTIDRMNANMAKLNPYYPHTVNNLSPFRNKITFCEKESFSHFRVTAKATT